MILMEFPEQLSQLNLVTSDIKNTSKEVSEIVIDKFFGF